MLTIPIFSALHTWNRGSISLIGIVHHQTFGIIKQWQYFNGDIVGILQNYHLKILLENFGYLTPNPFYLLLNALYSYFKINNIKSSFTPRPSFWQKCPSKVNAGRCQRVSAEDVN